MRINNCDGRRVSGNQEELVGALIASDETQPAWRPGCQEYRVLNGN